MSRFHILGTSDDGNLCFLNRHGYFRQCAPKSLNKSFLLDLESLNYWEANYQHVGGSEKAKDKVHWDMAIDDLLELSGKAFSLENTKGIGAWKSQDGKVCFHGGNPKKIRGEHPTDWVFIRMHERDIGLDSPVLSLDKRSEILATVKSLLFENWQEGVRLLCWASLASFSGALPWRSAGVLTGASGAGKSAVLDLVVRPLVGPLLLYVSGSTTEAGIRQATATDSRPVIIEESEADNQKEKEIRADQFKLMRQSTSDDTPKIYKGSKEGVSQAYSLKCMFLFSGINPQVEKEADENRLFFCHVKNPPKGGDPNWRKNKEALTRLMTKENMDGIRALVWQKLPKIIEDIEKLEDIIQEVAGLSSRKATAEAPLLAAYMRIWLGLEDIKVGTVRDIIREFYEGYENERRDETAELIEKILAIEVDIPETRERYTARELLKMLEKGSHLRENGLPHENELGAEETSRYRRFLGHFGIANAPKLPGGIAIAKNNFKLKKKLNVDNGFHKQLWRHDNCVDRNKSVRFGEATASAVIIKDVI